MPTTLKVLKTRGEKRSFRFRYRSSRKVPKGDLILRFNDVIADAPELGALRTESIRLTDDQEQWLAEVTPQKVPLRVTRTLPEYCLANKPAVSGLVCPARNEYGSVSR